MDAQSAALFLDALGAANVRKKERVVSASCPLAAFTHEKGTDKSPSFVIVFDGDPYWSCLGCNRRGSLLVLLWLLRRYKVIDEQRAAGLGSMLARATASAPSDLLARLHKLRAGQPEPSKEPKEIAGIMVAPADLPPRLREAPPFKPESTLARFERISANSAGAQYLTSRPHPIPLAWAREWDLRFSKRHLRLVIPIRDCRGRLVAYSGRATRKWQNPKYLHCKGFRRDFYLYGEHFVPKGYRGTVYLVEGFFDAHALHASGYQVALGIMGTALSSFQLLKVRLWATRVVIVLDGDKAGKEGADKIRQQIGASIPVCTVELPPKRDLDELTEPEKLELLGQPTPIQEDW